MLLELATKIDDDTLLKLSSNSFWREQIRALLSNEITAQDFWHRKTEYAAGTKLSNSTCRSECWKSIYFAIKLRKEFEDDAAASGVPIDWGATISVGLDEAGIRTALGLDSIEAFRVIQQLYPISVPFSGVDASMVLRLVDDPDVLQTLLQLGVIRMDDNVIEDTLPRVTRFGDKAMIDLLLSLLSSQSSRQARMEYVLGHAGGAQQIDIVREMLAEITAQGEIDDALILQAASVGNEETIRLLLTRVTDQSVIRDAADRAAEYDNPSALRVLLARQVRDASTNGLWHLLSARKQALFKRAYDSKSGKAMFVLIRDDPESVRGVDPDLLNSYAFLLRSIGNGHTDLVSLLLQTVDSSLWNERLLEEATVSREMFALVLSDPRIDPSAYIREIIEASRRVSPADRALLESIASNPALTVAEAYTDLEPFLEIGTDHHMEAEAVADLLVRDSRVDIERLDESTLRLMFWSLQSHVADRVKGFQKARGMVGSDWMESLEFGDLLEMKDDLYAKLSREIVLKRPSNEELIDWMIAQTGADRETFAFAAGGVLDDVLEPDEDITPIWALLSVALYPSLTLEQLVNRLRESSVDQETITRSAQLIGAHLGAERLK